MAEAFIGHVSVHIGRGATPTFTKLDGVQDVTWPESTIEQIEITDQDSTAREFMAGLIDNGEVSFDVNWVPDSDTHTLLQELKTSKELVQMRFSASPLGSTTVVYSETYAAIMTGFSKVTAVGDKFVATVTFRINGEIEV